MKAIEDLVKVSRLDPAGGQYSRSFTCSDVMAEKHPEWVSPF